MLTITSPAFKSGEEIPYKYSADGEGVSPPLEWHGAPDGVKEFALICEDPDAPTAEPFVHWIVYSIHGNVSSLPEAIPALEEVSSPLRLRQGENSTGHVGYFGPRPPVGHGWHRYKFKIFGLDQPIALDGGADSDEFYAAISSHAIAAAEIVGKFRRSERASEESRPTL